MYVRSRRRAGKDTIVGVNTSTFERRPSAARLDHKISNRRHSRLWSAPNVWPASCSSGAGPTSLVKELRMRAAIVVAAMVVAVAAGVTDGFAQSSRLTFQCEPTATACDGRFAMNGAKTFVLGVYDSGFLTPPADWEAALFSTAVDKYYRGLGGVPINMYLNYWQGMDTADQVTTLMTALAKHGVMWFQTANCSGDGSYTRYSPGFSVDRADGFAFAQQLAQHPAMAGYYIMDECGDAGYGTNLVPETQHHHSILKSYDPAAVNFAVPVARGYRDPLYWITPPYKDLTNTSAAPTADLFGTDPYPMYGSEGRAGYPQFEVGDYIARLRDDVPADKPVISVLQLFKFGGGGRMPTRAEMRMHAYASIVEGAQGLFWWDIGENGLRSRSVKANELATATANLNYLVNELKRLEPALLAPPSPGALKSVTPSFVGPRAWRIDAVTRDIPLISNYADKQWYQAELNALNAGDESLSPMLRQAAPQQSYIRTRTSIVGGVGYVIAYNYGNTAIKNVTFKWQSNLASPVEVFGEGRALPPSLDTFTDNFAPYEAHVYVVR
jgi:hypothetical protein